MSFPPQWGTVTPFFSQEIVKELQAGLIQIPVSLCFALGSSAHKNLCPFQEWSLHFPQPYGAPVHKPWWSWKPNAPRAPPPNTRPPGMETWCGAQNSHSYGWASVIQLLSSLWAAHLVGMGLLILHNHPFYNLNVASSLYFGVEYLFWSFSILFCW